MEANFDVSSFIVLQQQEADGAALYRQIAKFTKNQNERETLLAIARDEDRHAAVFEKYTGKKLAHNRLKLFWYGLATRLMGYTFVIRLLEKRRGRGDPCIRERGGKRSRSCPGSSRTKRPTRNS